MSNICNVLHHTFSSRRRHKFPFNESEIPSNGIYILFENGQLAHDTDRIVRVGTHRGDGRLIARLKEHFIKENKDRSIFRKNIGRALLAKRADSFLEQWNWDLTKREEKERLLPLLDVQKQKQIEKEVTEYIHEHFSFTVFEVQQKAERLDLESKIISTISFCQDCKQSENWLGNFSPVDKIQKSGLWLVQGLYKTPLSEDDSLKLKDLF